MRIIVTIGPVSQDTKVLREIIKLGIDTIRLNFSHLDNIDNKHLKTTANVAQNVGAEIISAYINPYYLSHKIINIPSNIVELYKKYSNS